MTSASRVAVLFGVLGVTAGVIASWSLHRSQAPGSTRAMLVAALGSDVPFDARLSGGFAAPARLRTRNGAGSPSAVLSPDARITLAEVEKRTAVDPSANAQADLAVAYLIQGNVDRAVQLLEDVALSAKQANIWTDLSGAYLLKAERAPERQLEYLARSLEAASQAIRINNTADARFNEALALQRLSPFLGELPDWQTYRAVETDARWLAVADDLRLSAPHITDADTAAADRLARLQAALEQEDDASIGRIVRESPEATSEFLHVQLLQRWARALTSGDVVSSQALAKTSMRLAAAVTAATGDPMPSREATRLAVNDAALARAHIAYVEGVNAYSRNDYGAARQRFTAARAGFGDAGSAYLNLAEVQLATIAFQERELESADRLLTEVERRTRRDAAISILGRALWMHGLVYVKQWRTGEALAAFKEAASIFEQTSQRENAAGVYHQLADTYRTLGEHQSTWMFMGRSLTAQSSIRQPVRRYLAYYNATLFTTSQGLLEFALRTQSAAVREAARSANDVAIVESLVQRAALHVRRADLSAARADVSGATERLASLPEGPLKQYQRAELDVLNAQLDPTATQAGAGIERALEFFGRAEPGRVPSLWLSLGRAHLAAGARERAVSAFRNGIDRLEEQQARVGDDALKISYFDDSWELFEQIMALHVDRQQYDDAFATADRSRSRLLRLSLAAEQRGVPQLAELSSALAPRTALLYYATLPDRLVIWGVTNRSRETFQIPIGAVDLGRVVAQHQSALLEGRASAVNDELYDALIAPARAVLNEVDTIVFAPDGLLQTLSFASLQQGPTKRYLVEDYDVLIAPSASLLGRGASQPASGPQLRSALIIGNPNTSAENLPGSEREAREIARFYSDVTMLTGTDATKEQFIRRAPAADIVHFAGHGYANAEYPLLSRLAFSRVGESEQSLFAHEIARLPFHRTRLVVLSACSTASGARYRGEGVVGVARPFLSAGVPQVIASLWDVDDHATEQLFIAFHRELATTRDPVGALRRAQLELIHSADPALRAVSAWGAFVVFGTASPSPSPSHNATSH